MKNRRKFFALVLLVLVGVMVAITMSVSGSDELFTLDAKPAVGHEVAGNNVRNVASEAQMSCLH